MEIVTERLVLREMEESDLEALYAVLGDAEIMQHYPSAFDREGVRRWISRNRERYRIFGFGLWAVCLRETGEVIGDCGLTMQDINGFIRPEIGYHIRADRQRMGYAGEAASAVRDWAFRNTPFRVLYSYTRTTNVPSLRTALSIGMRLTEVYTDAGGTEHSVCSVEAHPLRQ